MASKPLTSKEIKDDLQRLQDAIETIERHYPGYKLNLVPVSGAENQTPEAGQSDQAKPLSNRERVAEATRGRWLTIGQIVEETGLSTKQVYGVVTATDGPLRFERREVDGGPQKEYKLLEGPADE